MGNKGAGPVTVGTSAAYDCLGRLTDSNNAEGKHTHVAYNKNVSYLNVRTTFADGTYRNDDTYLEGRPKGVSGSAVYGVNY